MIIFMAQMIRSGLYPPPLNMDFADSLKMTEWMSTWSNKAYIVVAISHGLAAFAAGLISSLVVSKWRMTTGIIAISIIFIPVMVYLFTYHFPSWFVVADTCITAILGFVGVLIGSSRHVN